MNMRAIGAGSLCIGTRWRVAQGPHKKLSIAHRERQYGRTLRTQPEMFDFMKNSSFAMGAGEISGWRQLEIKDLSFA